MKYTIEGFSQEVLVNYGLDIIDAAILRWFIDFQGSGKMKLVQSPFMNDLGNFYWVQYQAVVDDLPSLGIKNKQVVARRFKKLCDVKVLVFLCKKKEGTYTCFRIGPRYSELIERSQLLNQEELTQKYRGVDSKVDPKDSSINSSIKHKDIKSTIRANQEEKGYKSMKELVPQLLGSLGIDIEMAEALIPQKR